MLDITKPQTCFTRKTDIIHKYSGKSNPTGDARVAPARVAAGDQSLAAAPPSHALPPRRRRSGLPEARAARGEGDGVPFPFLWWFGSGAAARAPEHVRRQRELLAALEVLAPISGVAPTGSEGCATGARGGAWDGAAAGADDTGMAGACGGRCGWAQGRCWPRWLAGGRPWPPVAGRGWPVAGCDWSGVGRGWPGPMHRREI